MNVVEDGGCFICGPNNPNGLKVQFEMDREGRRALCRMKIPSQFQGWQGVVHGGIVAALLDEAAIYACRTIGEQFVTAELAVRFRRPVPVSTDIVVWAVVVEKKRKFLGVKARLEIDGEVHAEADAKVFCLGDQPGEMLL